MSAVTYPVAVIAKLFGVTPRRVQQLAAEGIIPKGDTRGQYELAGSVRGYIQYLQDQAQRAQSGGTDLAAERARLMKARADLAEMEAEQRRGMLIAAENIEAAWIAVLALLRTRLLGIPDRLAPVVQQQDSVASARDVIKSAIREALDDLAETDVQAEPDADGDEDPDVSGEPIPGDASAAAGSDGERLGGREPPP